MSADRRPVAWCRWRRAVRGTGGATSSPTWPWWPRCPPPTGPVAARVVGLWPDAGFRLAVEVDEAVLAGAVDRVVDAVAVTADVRTAPCTAEVA